METAQKSPEAATLAPPYEPSRILRWLYRRFFSHITVDDKWTSHVRDAARRGVVVYVMRSLSFLDFFCLDFLVKQYGLPLVRFVNDLGLWILEPFGKGERRLSLRRQIPEEKALAEVVGGKASALLFLRKPPRLVRQERKGQKTDADLIRTLVEQQRQLAEPIFLVPQTFVWSKTPPNKSRTLLDLVFGPGEWPGKIRVFFQFLLNYRNALLRSGEPFDLQAFLLQHQDLTDAEAADKVRYALLRRMERERTLVLGPGEKGVQRIREEIARSPRVRAHMESAARSSGRSLAAVRKEVDKELAKLCAAPDPIVLALLDRLLDRVWHRIYDGMVIDKDGIERVRDAARTGNLVLVPSHKSHVDYLVLSDVLYAHALSTPLIAAGDNLSFWPLGPVLRRAGGFFIKRSFRGNKLYAALVDAYIRKVMVEGFTIEFFIEGGRSRTGKLLAPKLGLLSMIVDAALMLRQKPTYFVPISVGYERIVEEGSYARELAGGEKQKEDVGGLLQTPKVLRARYGKLYIQFGEIVKLDDVLREVGSQRDAESEDAIELSPPARRSLVQKIAHRVTYEIDRVTVATPAALVATALLSHRRRGIAQRELGDVVRTLLGSLRRLDARIAPPLLDAEGALRPETVEETLRLFIDGKLVVAHEGGEPIWSVPEEKRLALEYYVNNVLHFFVPSALISSVLLAERAEPIAETALRERVRRLSKLFKYEFMFRADAPFDQIFGDAIAKMEAAGEVERLGPRRDAASAAGSEDHVRPGAGSGGQRVALYASLLRTYFEGYRVALRATEALASGARLTRKEWLKRALTLGRRMYLAGEVELAESLSRPKLENALSALRDHGLVKLVGDDVLAAPDVKVEDVRALDARLAGYGG